VCELWLVVCCAACGSQCEKEKNNFMDAKLDGGLEQCLAWMHLWASSQRNWPHRAKLIA
jgi:hypothetical protein